MQALPNTIDFETDAETVRGGPGTWVFTGKAGDTGYIRNADNYLTASGSRNGGSNAWAGEYVVCTSSGGPLGAPPTFYGYPIGVRTYPEWLDILKAAYNSGLNWYWDSFNGLYIYTSILNYGGGWQPQDEKFINVAHVGLKLFNYRNKPTNWAQPSS